MSRSIECLTNLQSWRTDLDHKKWLVNEYLSTQSFSSRLKFILSMLKNYLESFFQNPKIERGQPLPHFKYLKSLVREYIHCRWINFNDPSKLENLSIIKFIYEICEYFNGLNDIRIGYATFQLIFSLDKSMEKSNLNAENEKRVDLDVILTAAVSYHSYNLLESAAFYFLSYSSAYRCCVDFRVGSIVFHELANTIVFPDDKFIKLLNGAPGFAEYMFFSICRKISSRLKTHISLQSFTNTPLKTEALIIHPLNSPTASTIRLIISYLRLQNLSKTNNQPEEILLPDISVGEVRPFIANPLNFVDDLAIISLGAFIWLSSLDEKNKSEIEILFAELHSIFLDQLLTLKASQNKQPIPETVGEDNEEGELELGELVEEISSSSIDPSESACIEIRIATFLAKALELGYINQPNLVSECIERFTQMILAMKNCFPFASNIEKEMFNELCQKIPKNPVLDCAINALSDGFKTSRRID